MNFTKMQGAGNDFILVEADETRHDWSSQAVTMCDRHFGIGSDGLLLLLPSDKADFKMRMFDPDGSEAEACGNGIRCLAKYIYEEGLINRKTNQMSIETIAGIRELRLYKKNGKLVSIQAGMGKPKFSADDIPVVAKSGREAIVYIKYMLCCTVKINGMELPLNLVSMGNPHAVYFSREPVSDFPLLQLGPKVENLDIFPRRVNFEVARVMDRQRIELRVWERGAGETLACGSGASAVAVAGQLHDYIDSKVDISLPGGTLQVEWDGSGEVLMSGPAEKVFSGEWPE